MEPDAGNRKSDVVFRATMTLALSVCAMLSWGGPAAATAATPNVSGGHFLADSHDSMASLCRQQMTEIEKFQGIPAGLLTSIGIVEAGRWDDTTKKVSVWPWTVTAQGVGKFYPSKALAIAAVRKLQTQGVRNIDVGCMQINLLHHPDAFTDLNEAFDPSENVAYAASFLNQLRGGSKSWRKAIAYYHSSTPARHRPYVAKVYRTWREVRQERSQEDRRDWSLEAEAKRKQILAARLERREAWVRNLTERRTRFADWVARRLVSHGTREPAPHDASDDSAPFFQHAPF